MRIIKVVLILCIFFLSAEHVYAYEPNMNILSQQIDVIDFSEVDYIIRNDSHAGNINIRDLIIQIVTGQFQFSMQNIWDIFLNTVMSEVAYNSALIRNLIVISFLSALLKNLTDSFKETMVAEIAFYSCYIVLITILFSSFRISVSIVQDLMNSLINIMQATVPMVLAMLYMSGNIAMAGAVNPIIVFGVHILAVLIRDLIVPIIIFAAVIQIINYLSKKEFLSKFSSFIEDGVKSGLKLTAVAFISILSIQGIAAPILNNVMNRSARALINVVPVVGDVLTGTMDIVATYAGALRSGAMVAFIVIIVTMCVVPILQLVVLIVIYKLTAVVMQPVCDERVVKCLDAVGNFTILLLGAAVTIAVMFIFAVVIVLSV